MVRDKEKLSKYNKEYSTTEIGKMNKKIGNWKSLGLICKDKEEYIIIYKRWLDSKKCEEPKCNKEYTETNWKCMDHNHDTGLFRNIICHSCNCKRRTKKNLSGVPNIIWNEKKKGWTYQIKINGKNHSKYSKRLEWLKYYKEDYEEEYLYKKNIKNKI
tara:strand:+ start:4719 stop:5192 length:474 start_codon:yes stop_codon:yes gene_type:complete